jgi:hypothetical protein
VTDPEPPYTRAEVWAAFERVADRSDHYETERERAAYIDACIAMHMALCHDQLPAKYALSECDE